MNLATSYMGFELPHPLVPGAGPFVDSLDTVRRLEDAGAPLIVMHSLFEEQVAREEVNVTRSIETPKDSFAEALSYFPEPEDFVLGPEEYLEQVRKVKAAVSVPVIGSLNGTTEGGWLRYARLIEQAGADGLELNLYELALDLGETGAEVERRGLEVVRAVKGSVKIPVAVKLSPFYSSIGNFARRLDEAGADALVLFNRFYQPDYDLEALEVVPNLILSNSHELLLRLHWIAVIYGSVKADLALTGGVHSATDVVKAMMAGAKVAMMTSALLKRGIGYLDTIATELLVWMGEHEYDSIKQMQGSMSRNAVPQPGAFERVNYLKVLSSYAMR
jgi:dihydroorotate dehydrogenase (fumarate)